MICGRQPLAPEILDQTDRIGAKSTIFYLFLLVATQCNTIKVQLTLIGSRLHAFQWAQDEHLTLSLSIINQWKCLWHIYINITANWLRRQLHDVHCWIFTINYTGSLTEMCFTNITSPICPHFAVFFTHANHLSCSFC